MEVLGSKMPSDHQVLKLRDPQAISDQELIRWAQFGRILAGLIHELSTPLTAAALTLDQLQHENHDRLIKEARRDLRQLERYVVAARNQLRGESSSISFSLNAAIRQVVKLFSSRAKTENVKLVVKLSGNIRMHGDLVKFHQIIANLINNAIDACEYSANQRVVKIDSSLLNQCATISVSDSGSGIEPENLSKIFEPFYSTKSTYGCRLGVGLDLVKRYIEYDFKGTIKVQSEVNTGTHFVLSIPVCHKEHKPTLSRVWYK